MVFLRLTVKVYPRDQIQTSNSFSFRSLLGDRERDDSSRNSSDTTTGKPASFLIVLENPEDVTLGGLAGMIREKWRKLRPGAETLEIKKLVDDDHEADDLDTDMTVAHVFVDIGKARSDGHDQRRAVRVIQKSTRGQQSPVRFPSVTQDWDAAAERYEMQRLKKEKQEAEFALNKLGPIAEETRRDGSTPPMDSWSDYTPGRKHRRDIPVSSVEKDEEIPLSPSQRPQSIQGPSQDHGHGSVAQERLESQELGDSPPSSRAPTPKGKLTAARRDSAHSQGFRSGTGDAAVSDSPGLRLTLENATHPVSLQKIPSPKGAEIKQISLDAETRSEDESEDESEGSDESGSEVGKGEYKQDNDGDIAMGDEVTLKKQQQSRWTSQKLAQSPSAKETAKATEIPAEDSNAMQSRKRKNSTEQLSPNKERRLDKSTPPAIVNGERRNSEASPNTPKYSPSGRRLERASSFSGVARRLSFTELPLESPRPGLGLGITRSPPKKALVIPNPSQDSTKSSEAIQSTPLVPSRSAPTVRRGSLAQNISTPNSIHTPADRLKNLHSALRNSSVERNSERRSVSFAESNDALTTKSQPASKSTLTDVVDSPISTPASQPASSEKRRSSRATVQYPPGYSPEDVRRLEQEARVKLERENKERAEVEEKIETAKKHKADPEYITKLEGVLTLLKWIRRNTNNSRLETQRIKLEQQQAEIKELESSMSKASQGIEKKVKGSRKSRKSGSKDIAAPATTTPAINNNISPVTHISGWNAVNGREVPTSVKPPTANGTGPKSTPKVPASKSKPQKASKPTSLQSQNSTASDPELPAMKVQARVNSTKKLAPHKSTPKKPVEVSSSPESESSEEESTSESESDSDSDLEKKPAKATPAPKATSPQKLKSTSPSSAQRTAKSSAPSTSQTQTQAWSWPARASQTTRLSLKGIKGEVASQAAAKTALKRAPNVPPRKGIFSPPGSDSEDTESESESDSSSSDESDSEKENKPIRKHSQSPVSVCDAGDIMSSGQVQRLRPARPGRVGQ
ncbi:hypothetical protein BDW59DRAFT_15347 [Aspergillus cavernicola]|uniref:Nucleolar protein Dnt1-like N-terminal domain-containing protein n=1 Tax=Aspergillus cavernicola TaxID=176166 RepID=A0ABR4HLM8_9EURO